MVEMVKSATSSVPSATGSASPPDARYRIAAVADLTGIPEPTLRAWERRYGIPAPERTASGYRLYGEAEIGIVREMRRLCAQGMAAAEAAKLLREPLRDGLAPAPSREPPLGPLEASVKAMLEAVERFDDVALEHEIRRAAFLGTATELLDGVVTPVLQTVGDRWLAGELTVAQEHLASHQLGAFMHHLLRLLPRADAAGVAVLGSFADDEHELGLLGIALRFAAWGLRPVFLGARTPPEALRSAVEALSPKLVALSVTVTPEKRRARVLVEAYSAACGRTPWIIGGAGVGPLAADITNARGRVFSGHAAELDAPLRAMVEKIVVADSHGRRRSG